MSQNHATALKRSCINVKKYSTATNWPKPFTDKHFGDFVTAGWQQKNEVSLCFFKLNFEFF